MHKYTEEEEKWIANHYKGISSKDLTAKFNERFNINVDEDSIRAYKKNRKMRSGYNTKFVKGRPSANKGKHVTIPGSERGWFKKGNIPHNYVPVGTLSYTTGERYLIRKIAEPNTWEFEHKLVWAKKYGTIPDGMMIIFLDGDRKNVTIENLAMISRDENQAMNIRHLRSKKAETTKAGLTMVRLEKAIKKAKKRREE